MPSTRESLLESAAELMAERGIERVGQLAERGGEGLTELGLDREEAIQVRDVLASRGL